MSREDYDFDMDGRCVSLCDAINAIPWLHTTESCCGHGDGPFCVWFEVDDLKYLPALIGCIGPKNSGFNWTVTVQSFAIPDPLAWRLCSESVGEQAYREANAIAEHVSSHLNYNKKLILGEDTMDRRQWTQWEWDVWNPDKCKWPRRTMLGYDAQSMAELYVEDYDGDSGEGLRGGSEMIAVAPHDEDQEREAEFYQVQRELVVAYLSTPQEAT